MDTKSTRRTVDDRKERRTRNAGGTHARMRVLVAAVTLVVILSAAARQAAAADQYVNDFGIGLGTVVVDFLYMPAKVVYATLGGITGGMAFLLTGGRSDIASEIWTPSMGGTYVLTPPMLSGEEPIYFSGGAGSGDDGRDGRDENRTEQPRDSGTPREGY
jgi:hypothetical protein